MTNTAEHELIALRADLKECDQHLADKDNESRELRKRQRNLQNTILSYEFTIAVTGSEWRIGLIEVIGNTRNKNPTQIVLTPYMSNNLSKKLHYLLNTYSHDYYQITEGAYCMTPKSNRNNFIAKLVIASLRDFEKIIMQYDLKIKNMDVLDHIAHWGNSGDTCAKN